MPGESSRLWILVRASAPEHLHFDCDVNRLTGTAADRRHWKDSWASGSGSRQRDGELFGKIRAGFIHYQEAWSGSEKPRRTDLSRIAVDADGAVEFYPDRRSTIRVDFDTTLVRNFLDYPNPLIPAVAPDLLRLLCDSGKYADIH